MSGTWDGGGTPAAGAAQPAAPPGWYPTPDGTTAWWDGYQWMAAPPPSPTAAFRPVETLGAATTALLVACGVSAVLSGAADLNRYLLIGRSIDDPFSVSYDQLSGADGLAGLAAILRIVVILPTIVVFLVWLHRVYRNLDGPLRAGTLECSAGWAVGWWFVPFANLVKPRQIVIDAWKASDPGSADPAVAATHWRHRKPPALMNWWWGTWIGAGVLSRVAVGINNSASSRSGIQTSMLWASISSFLLTAAAVLAVLVVRSVTARHTQRAENLAAQAWA